MAKRSGLEDVFKALTIGSAIYALYEFANKGKSIAEANKRHQETKERLARIEKKLNDR